MSSNEKDLEINQVIIFNQLFYHYYKNMTICSLIISKLVSNSISVTIMQTKSSKNRKEKNILVS